MTATRKPKGKMLATAALALFLIPLLPLYSGGGQEDAKKASEGEIEVEGSREIHVYTVTKESRGVAATNQLPGSEAASFLFQQFSKSGNTVRIRSDRSFSMPIREKSYVEIDNPLGAVEYRGELSPEKPLSYVSTQGIRLTFDTDDLTSGSGKITQPARYAVLEALQQANTKTGLVRVKTLSHNGKGTFTAEVELAEAAPSKK